MSSFKIIIVGAGLAGCLLANGLHHKAIDVVVYERLPRDTDREGYQIRLGSPALKGFRACLNVDQIAELVQRFGRTDGTKSSAPIVYDRHFKALADLTRIPSYSKSAAINRVVLRDCLAAPIESAGKLHYDKKYERYEILDAHSSQERVRVWFDDGTFDDCAILIGADGSHSRINSQVGLKNLQTITTHISAVAKTDLRTSAFLKMTPALAKYPVIAFDSNRTMYFAAYLPDKLDLGDKLDDTRFDDELSSCFLGVHFPVELCPPNFEQMSREDKWAVVSEALGDWSKEYHEVIDLLKTTDMHVYRPRVSTRPSKHWRRQAQVLGEGRGHPRVWLMGDAVHAMLPNRGQGGNQSLRDAATILPLLVKLASAARCGNTPTTKDVEIGCRNYEEEMIPRAFEWVQKSGGTNIVPIDANTLAGRVGFSLIKLGTAVFVLWKKISGLFGTPRSVDDAPELHS